MGKVVTPDNITLITRRFWRIKHETKPMRWRDMGDGWGHYVELAVPYSAFNYTQRHAYDLPPHGVWEVFVGILDECGWPVENAPYILYRA